MGISVVVGDEGHPLGTPSFFKAFFSTVFVRLEGGSWGSLFPIVMRQLYAGGLDPDAALVADSELQRISDGLRVLPPTDVVWDFENRTARPPWGDRLSPHVTSLANYFVTSEGSDLIELLRSAARQSAERRQPLRVT